MYAATGSWPGSGARQTCLQCCWRGLQSHAAWVDQQGRNVPGFWHRSTRGHPPASRQEVPRVWLSCCCASLALAALDQGGNINARLRVYGGRSLLDFVSLAELEGLLNPDSLWPQGKRPGETNDPE